MDIDAYIGLIDQYLAMYYEELDNATDISSQDFALGAIGVLKAMRHSVAPDRDWEVLYWEMEAEML